MLTFAQARPLEPQIIRGSKTNMACYWKNSKYLQTKLGLKISSCDFEILNKGGGVVKTLRKSRFAEKKMKKYVTQKFLGKALRRTGLRCTGAFRFQRGSGDVDNQFRHYCRILEKCFIFRELNFNFEGDWCFPKRVRNLAQGISCFNRLEKIHLNSQRAKNNDVELKIISSSLRRLGSSLKIIQLYMHRYEVLTDDGLRMFSKRLRRLIFLKAIDFNFSFHEKIRKDGLWRVLESLTNLRNLAKICGNFARCGCERMLSASSEIFRDGFIRTKNLKEITINFSKTYMRTSSLINLCQGIGQGISLEKLDLDFSSCLQLNKYALFCLEKLEGLANLKEIRLSFQGYQVLGDEGLRKIGEFLENFDSLEVIDLDFSLCEFITDQGVIYLKQSLKRCFRAQIPQARRLHKLSLKFQGCPRITSKGAKCIIELIYKTSPFVQFSFDFLDCKRVKMEELLDWIWMLLEKKKNFIERNRAEVLRIFFESYQESKQIDLVCHMKYSPYGDQDWIIKQCLCESQASCILYTGNQGLQLFALEIFQIFYLSNSSYSILGS